MAIDIGAHQGDTAVPIAVACGSTGQVLAFEPNPFVLPVLRRNSELNPGRANIVVCPYAATETDGSFVFWYSDQGYHNGGSHGGLMRWRHGHMMPLAVEGRNLHALMSEHYPDALPRLKFIKVDTEGHDLIVLRSFEEMIRRRRPYVRAEMYLRWSLAQRTEMLEFFKALDYSVRRWDDDFLDGKEIDLNNLLRWNKFDIFAAPRERKPAAL